MATYHGNLVFVWRGDSTHHTLGGVGAVTDGGAVIGGVAMATRRPGLPCNQRHGGPSAILHCKLGARGCLAMHARAGVREADLRLGWVRAWATSLCLGEGQGLGSRSVPGLGFRSRTFHRPPGQKSKILMSLKRGDAKESVVVIDCPGNSAIRAAESLCHTRVAHTLRVPSQLMMAHPGR